MLRETETETETETASKRERQHRQHPESASKASKASKAEERRGAQRSAAPIFIFYKIKLDTIKFGKIRLSTI